MPAMILNSKVSGQGKPVVVLHGLFGMLDNWRSIARALEAEFQWILLDLRNHGKSGHEAGLSYPIMAEDVIETLDAMQIEHFDLIGHSMGAKVAMQVAASFPGRLNSLVAVDMANRNYPAGHDAVFRALKSFDPAQIKSRDEAQQAMSVFLDEQDVLLFLMKNLSRDRDTGAFRWKMNLPEIEREYEQILQAVEIPWPFSEPVCFIRGAKSNYVRDSDWEDLQSYFPMAELITVHDAGHWVHAEKPQEIVEHFRSFLQS